MLTSLLLLHMRFGSVDIFFVMVIFSINYILFDTIKPAYIQNVNMVMCAVTC